MSTKFAFKGGESVGVPVTEPGSICDKTIYETLKREA